jgi:hypothetical protein
MRNWVRVTSEDGHYGVTEIGSTPEPVFPEMSFNDCLRIAFRENIITTLSHPIVRELRGEVV